MKALLLNPPGHRLYIRDYFCSKVSKSGYQYPPTDLLIQSGILAERFELAFVDAIAEGLDVEACLSRIEALRPDFLLSLVGSVSLREDTDFLAALRRRVPGLRLAVGIGDPFCEDPAGALKRISALDAVLADFTSLGAAKFFSHEADHGLTTRASGAAPSAREPFSLPRPRHELFRHPAYRFPFVRKRPFAVLLTNYGCPYRCSFCVMPGLGFRVRDVDNTLAEMDWLKTNGYRDLYFNDQTFGADKKRTRQLLEEMVRRDYGFGFVCFTRVDLMDEELLGLLRRAGGHTVMFGVESSDAGLLKAYEKGITPDQVLVAQQRCRKLGLRTVATFILGLPGETRQTAEATIAFAKALDPDFASFNLAVPRLGTQLRGEALEKGYAGANALEMDQSGAQGVLSTEALSAQESAALRDRASREFYLRPDKILGRLLDIRSFVDLENLARNGLSVLVEALLGRRA